MPTRYWPRTRAAVKSLLSIPKNKEDERFEVIPIVGSIEVTILTADLLWRIFDMMSRNEMNKAKYRLKQIKNCSQVCREWRHILLESPSIWGRLMHFNYYQRKGWVEEIFRRSKSCALWMDVYFDFCRPKLRKKGVPLVTEDFVFSFLECHWERIEVFRWKSEGRALAYPKEVWRLFQRSAPLLKKFTISIPSQGEVVIFFDMPPFIDNAPRLQEFETDIITFKSLGKSWFRNLRVINFPDPNRISFRHLMEILGNLHQLEYLAAYPISNEPIGNLPSTSLDLPSLSWVSIEISLEQFVHFIQRVRPASGCSLICNVRILWHLRHEETIHALFEGLRDPVCRLLGDHVACHHSGTMESLELSMNYGSKFVFSCCNANYRHEKLNTAHGENSAGFSLGFSYWGHHDDPITMAILISHMYTTFTFPILKEVRCLDVSYMGWIDDPSHINCAFSLFQALPSVTCLHVDNFLPTFLSDLDRYNHLSLSNGREKFTFPFPRLNTVYTDMFSEAERGMDRSLLTNLKQLLYYLKERRTTSTPKHTLRIKLGMEVANITALAKLVEEFEDLEIIHRSIVLLFERVVNPLKHRNSEDSQYQ